MIAATYPGTVVPNLSDSQIKDIFLNLDSVFNRVMLHASLHGEKGSNSSREVTDQTFFLKEFTPV